MAAKRNRKSNGIQLRLLSEAESQPMKDVLKSGYEGMNTRQLVNFLWMVSMVAMSMLSERDRITVVTQLRTDALSEDSEAVA